MLYGVMLIGSKLSRAWLPDSYFPYLMSRFLCAFWLLYTHSSVAFRGQRAFMGRSALQDVTPNATSSALVA